jgi:hypothetical protein
MGLPGAGWAEEDHILLAGDKVQGAEVGDQVAFQTAGVVEVELLNAFAGREPGGPDPALAAVGISCRDLALQTGRQVFPGLMAPRFGARPLGSDRRARHSYPAPRFWCRSQCQLFVKSGHA